MPKEEKNSGELSLPTPTFSTNAEIQTLLKRVSRHHWMVLGCRPWVASVKSSAGLPLKLTEKMPDHELANLTRELSLGKLVKLAEM